jgi:hypothetical protein
MIAAKYSGSDSEGGRARSHQNHCARPGFVGKQTFGFWADFSRSAKTIREKQVAR